MNNLKKKKREEIIPHVSKIYINYYNKSFAKFAKSDRSPRSNFTCANKSFPFKRSIK